MLTFPNAKINIGLHIVEKRNDGYHNIETVFYPLKLKDGLEILPALGETQFHPSGLVLPEDPANNLCLRAYRLLKQDFPQIPSVEIYLHKVIPFGAGLGGGSSDAAFTIKMINDLFVLNLSKEEMQKYCRQIGSDCAFFLENKAVYAFEKGDKFIDCPLDLTPYKIVLIKPPFGISTAEAYANLKLQKAEIKLQQAIIKPVSEWKQLIENDFEKALFPLYPQLSEIKKKLYLLGALYASMTGSGSAFFGLFEKENNICFGEKFPDCFVWEE